MDDRELLELAARAAGIDLRPMQINNVTEPGDDRFIGYLANAEQCPRGWFTPLTDDGDALRLAVRLGISIDRTSNRCWAWAAGMAGKGVCEEFYKDEPYAATRRAIVRAAAEIGRALKTQA